MTVFLVESQKPLHLGLQRNPSAFTRMQVHNDIIFDHGSNYGNDVVIAIVQIVVNGLHVVYIAKHDYNKTLAFFVNCQEKCMKI